LSISRGRISCEAAWREFFRVLYHTVLEPCGAFFERVGEARFALFCPLASTVVRCFPSALLSPNTYKQIHSSVYHHLIPAFGHIAVQKLKAEQIQAYYAQKLKEGLSPASIGVIHAALHRALENAVKWGLISRNVSKLVTRPRIERYNSQTLTGEQAKKLLEKAKGSRIEALLLVALTTGMRRGELLALRWGDIDLEKGVLYVQRTVSHVPHYGYVESEPKTQSGRRRIVLPSVTIDALKAHRIYQDKVRLEAGEKWSDRGIVFANHSGGFLRGDTVLDLFYQLLKDVGLPPMRFHDLRHSAATILNCGRCQSESDTRAFRP
jgi:integrase